MPLVGTRPLLLIAGAASALLSSPAAATVADAQRLARLEMLVAAQEARILSLEAELAAARPPAPVGATPPAAPREPATTGLAERLHVTGDLRLRVEHTAQPGARRRDRMLARARLRASYDIGDGVTVGAQLATGDPEDPNSTDVTLSGFADDLEVSLDQLYVRARRGSLEMSGGKFPLPFARTDLVWDGDVSPQGLSAAIEGPLGSGRLRASALYFVIDEAIGGPDSWMAGGQLEVVGSERGHWRTSAAFAYYDYQLRSPGDPAGDQRTNLVTPDGRYRSDFNLVNALATLTYGGLGTGWPVRLSADVVRNLGAATDADTGFGVDVALGEARVRGTWRVAYGYARAEADAVLAAFSHDNTTIGTSYVQHMLLVDHSLGPGLLLNASLYHYRPLGTNDWLDRLRLQMTVSF